jgi:hypothetical protein
MECVYYIIPKKKKKKFFFFFFFFKIQFIIEAKNYILYICYVISKNYFLYHNMNYLLSKQTKKKKNRDPIILI